jgi:hypothetical protein
MAWKGLQIQAVPATLRVIMERKLSSGSNGPVATRRLAVMNPALRGIEADFGPEHAEAA